MLISYFIDSHPKTIIYHVPKSGRVESNFVEVTFDLKLQE